MRLLRYEKLKANPEHTANALSESGHVCRSSWNKDAVFFHFFGDTRAGHGHADKLHIDIYSNGEDILLIRALYLC